MRSYFSLNTTRRTSLYTLGETSTTMPTCPSRSTGAYTRLGGAASGSTPSNCTTNRALPSSLKYELRAEVLETMLYGCVAWSPRACHYDTLRRAHHSFLTRGIDWRNNICADHPIFWLDTLIKTESESIEATLRRRRILFTAFVARMEDTRLPKCVMFGELVGGAGCVWGGRKKSAWGVSWTTSELSASPPTSEQLHPRTRGNGAERRNKGRNISWRNRSLQRKPGLVCRCDVVCFVFVFMLSLKPRPFVQPFFNMQAL